MGYRSMQVTVAVHSVGVGDPQVVVAEGCCHGAGGVPHSLLRASHARRPGEWPPRARALRNWRCRPGSHPHLPAPRMRGRSLAPYTCLCMTPGKGDHLLVHPKTGAVGLAAIRICLHRACEVISSPPCPAADPDMKHPAFKCALQASQSTEIGGPAAVSSMICMGQRCIPQL